MTASDCRYGKRLHFIIHWSGGVRTQFEVDKPGHGSSGKKTSSEALGVRAGCRLGDRSPRAAPGVGYPRANATRSA
jgi:hypothetical protein